jgi:hypothetical protein
MPLALEPDSHERHRSVPIKETITRIPGYPRKLVIFKIPASSYWWVRYYAEKHIFKRTTKTEIKRDALEAAKRFYDDITIRMRGGNFEGLPLEVNVAAVVTFAKATKMLMDSELAKLNRSQLSKISYENMALRYDKHILPFFGEIDVRSINYKMLDEFLQRLSNREPKLSVSTLGAYMGLTRKVLQHAARHSFIEHIPEFPKVGIDDKPRGWFNVGEYKAITKAAKKLAGKKMEWRAHTDQSKGSYFCNPGFQLDKDDRLIKRIEITKDLPDLIVFMVNSYIRPTDIRNMKHKHVDIVRREWTYLRLSLPPSKGHTFPITTMPWAVKVYERICKRQAIELGRPVQPEDHVFLPAAASRDAAMKVLAKQFEVVLQVTGLKVSNSGDTRTLYSLRHSCIMFRLLFGRGLDTLTLARNARTSPEMIDRFYAAPLQGEMNVGELQSKRRPRPWE